MKKFGFVIAVQMLAAIVLCSLPEPAQAAETEELCNVVLFASMDTSANFMETYSDKIQKLCNDENTIHSLTGYVDAISYGQTHVTSYFPQLKNGVIEPYQLTLTDYSTCEFYAFEMLRNIEIPASLPLDGNGDGLVDSVTLIVEGRADDQNSPIWPKQFGVPGATLGGMPVGSVTIHNSHHLFEDVVTGGEGVLCHEFLHGLGYPDLYRTTGGTPVGMWDVMASNSVFLQLPLAYQRSTISGWLPSETITEGGRYTLAPAGQSDGKRLYLLKTPLSETEFFAVEYRRQGARYSNEMDVKIPGTGLCVYRVNTEVVGNFKENRDQIYIFRPGETALDAGEGDLQRSAFGGENAPDHVGSLDPADGFAEGALVYSNGTNSGIRISDIDLNADSATFSVEFAEVSCAEVWESVKASEVSGMPCGLVRLADDRAVLLSSDQKSAYLYQISGDKITTLGKPLQTAGIGGMYEPQIVVLSGKIYLMYRDRDFLVHIARQDETGWTEIYKGKEMAQFGAFTESVDGLYLAHTVGSFPYALHVLHISEDGSVVELPSVTANSVCNLSVAVADGSPVVGYRDLTDGDKPKVAVYRDKWDIYEVGKNCSGVSVAAENGTILATPWGAGNGCALLENGDFSEIPLPGTENAFMQLPACGDGQMFVAVNAQDPDKLTVYRLTNGRAEQAGDVLANEVVNGLSMCMAGKWLYCAYSTGNGTPVVKRLEVGSSGVIQGDVDANGQLNAVDVRLLQAFILNGANHLPDPDAGDMNGDGVIDIYDLGLLKQIVMKGDLS